jgi:hypothetical protein
MEILGINYNYKIMSPNDREELLVDDILVFSINTIVLITYSVIESSSIYNPTSLEDLVVSGFVWKKTQGNIDDYSC